MSNYPPGVNGSEYAIAGPDFEEDYNGSLCVECGGYMMVQGYKQDRWVICYQCGYEEDLEPAWGDDPRYDEDRYYR